jgi:hypothetical protein
VSWTLWILGFSLCIEVVQVNRPLLNNGSATDEATADGATLGSWEPTV